MPLKQSDLLDQTSMAGFAEMATRISAPDGLGCILTLFLGCGVKPAERRLVAGFDDTNILDARMSKAGDQPAHPHFQPPRDLRLKSSVG